MPTLAMGNPIAPASRRTAWMIGLAFAALYAAAAGWFAALQNVWIDESTQLLGSRLPLPRLIAWLAGHPEPLGVPGDRMPPVSYLVDWSCGRTLCVAVGGYRALHILLATGGVALIAGVSARRYGAAAGLVAGVLLLTPQLVTVGGEVRAYPLFFAATCLQLALFHRLSDRPEIGWPPLIGFAAAGLLATYTHFFGLVSTSALFTGLVAARVRSRGEMLRVGAAWGAVLLLSAGILPFVGGARAVSDAVPPDASAGAIIAYLLRVPGHASMLRAPVATGAFFLCFGLLLAIAVGGAARRMAGRPLRARADAPAGLAVAVAAGLGVTIAAALVVHGFDPLKPSYSIWLLPVLACLAAAALAPGRGFPVRAALGIALALALAAASLPLARHGGWYVHGPERAIAEQIGGDPAGTAVIHLGPSWGYAYFPLVRDYGRGLAQYRVDEAGRLRPIGWGGDPRPAPVPPAVLSRYRRLLIAAVDLRRAPAIDLPLVAPISDGLALRPGEWHRAAPITRPGLYALGLTRLDRTTSR